MLRFARWADTLNTAVQLLLGVLLVGGIDVWFISRALQGVRIQPSWAIWAIPVGATALWTVGASVALHIAILQRGHADSSGDDEPGMKPAETDEEMRSPALSQILHQWRR